MMLVRIFYLIAAILALTSVGRSQASTATACDHGNVSQLLGGFHTLKSSLGNDTVSHHRVLPPPSVGPSSRLPEPLLPSFARAVQARVRIELKHAYSSQYSGLSPPPAFS